MEDTEHAPLMRLPMVTKRITINNTDRVIEELDRSIRWALVRMALYVVGIVFGIWIISKSSIWSH